MRGILFILLFTSLACNSVLQEHSNESPLARVGENYLFPSDLEKFGVSDLNDSTGQIKEVVDEWIVRQLMLSKAEQQLSNTNAIDIKVADYRASLLMHEYTTALLNKSVIEASEEEVKAYFESHKENFLLEESVFRMEYVLLPSEVQQVNSIKSDLDKGEVPNFILEICADSKSTCALDLPFWCSKEFAKDNLQISPYDLYVTSKFRRKTQENGDVLLYRISEIRNKGDVQPLSNVQELITHIVVNKKKKEVLADIENKIYINAKNNQSVEIYN